MGTLVYKVSKARPVKARVGVGKLDLPSIRRLQSDCDPSPVFYSSAAERVVEAEACDSPRTLQALNWGNVKSSS